MQTLGVDFHLGRRRGASAGRRRGIVTTLASGLEIAADKVLASSGRSGCTGHGSRRDRRGARQAGYVTVDGDYRTTVPSIYAGRFIGFPALASTSMEQARGGVSRLRLRTSAGLSPATFGIFTIPELSCIGFSEEEATQKGLDFVVGRAFYRDNARARSS